MKTANRLLSLALSAMLTLGALTACTNAPVNDENVSPDSSVSGENQAQNNSNTANSDTDDGFITVIDHADKAVKVPKKIERIVVCDILPVPSVLAVFFDSAEKIVGMSPSAMTAAKNSLLSELYPEILEANTGFIQGTNVNVEELLKLDPDVVIYSAASTPLGEKLTNAGFAAVAVSPSKWQYDAIETLNQWTSLFSQMFPENDKTEIVKQYSNEVFERVNERIAGLPEDEREKVFFLFQYNDTTLTTSGNSFFGQWWADAIGAKNVGEEMKTDNSTAVNMEQVYKWNPETILITNFTAAQPDDLYNNTIGNYDWSIVDAVKNKKVYKMPLGMYRSYTCGVDTPVTLLWLAKTVYPELFKDIDITKETRDYYKNVFGIELTDEQANKIFAPVSAATTINY